MTVLAEGLLRSTLALGRASEQELRSLVELLTWKLAVDRKLLKPTKGSSRPADRATTGSIWCRVAQREPLEESNSAIHMETLFW